MGSSSSSCRLGIGRYIVSAQQPLEDLFFSDAALHFLQPAALLELGVDLAGVRSSFFSLLRYAVIKVLFGRGQTFLFRNRFDHQVPADLTFRHRPELPTELLTLVFGYLIGLGVVLNELLDPAFGNIERVG